MSEIINISVEQMSKLISEHWEQAYSKHLTPIEIFESVEDDIHKLLNWFEEAVYYFKIRPQTEATAIELRETPIRFTSIEYDYLLSIISEF